MSAEHHREQRNSVVHQITADKAAQRQDLKKRDCTKQDLQKRRSQSKQQSQDQNKSTEDFHTQRSSHYRTEDLQ